MWTLFFVLLFGSCSRLSLQKEVLVKQKEIPVLLNRDYVDQLEHFSSHYEDSISSKKINLSRSNKKYLEKIIKKVLVNNELLLPQGGKVEFTIFKESAPVFFSFPGYKFFFSSGLIKKYITNESLLVSIVVYELIKSGRKIYKKKNYNTIGYLGTKTAVDLTRVDSGTTANLYKWTYVAMNRSGYDGSSVLNIIQIMSRNKMDFSWQMGNQNEISSVELKFKNFVVAQGVDLADMTVYKSSNNFYDFKRNVLR